MLGKSGKGPAAERAPVPSREAAQTSLPVVVPDSLIAVQAYVMWEEAGKPQVCWAGVYVKAWCRVPPTSRAHAHCPPARPQGADFGAPARNRIEDKLRSGMTLQQIEQELKGGDHKQQQSQEAQKPKQQRKEDSGGAAAVAVSPPAPSPAAPPAKPDAEVGRSLGPATRDPLHMIKVSCWVPA